MKRDAMTMHAVEAYWRQLKAEASMEAYRLAMQEMELRRIAEIRPPVIYAQIQAVPTLGR